MNKDKTPQPGSEDYDVEQPQELNIPKFNSSTEKRGSDELPAVENMDGMKKPVQPENRGQKSLPDTNLGNDRDDYEDEKEKIIRT